MAIVKPSAFAQFAAKESDLRTSLASIVYTPLPPTAHELRAQRKAAKRMLNALLAESPDQITFVKPEVKVEVIGTVEPASQTSTALAQLEEEMRAALGLGDITPRHVAITPRHVAITPKPQPAPKKPIAAPSIKRQIEVMLQVTRTDGTQVPFWHMDTCVSSLEAELNASRKARKYGLTVNSVISVEVKEYACRL